MTQTSKIARIEPVVDVFARQAREHPESRALAFGGTTLSYREVDSRSHQIAAGLLADHVPPGSRLGLCGAPSADLYLAMLGVLRAGCSYVPLDFSYPLERLRFIADDAALDAALATNGDGHRVVQALPLPGVSIGPDFHAGTPIQLPTIDEGSEAYVIYTSGSTGMPKGVGVTHGNVSSLLRSIGEKHRFGVDDVWTLAHSHAFDWSVLELWGAWFYGGCAVVVPLEFLPQPEVFSSLLRDHGVTVVNLSPSAFRGAFTLNSMKSGCLEPLRYMILGSERLDLPMLTSYFPLLSAHQVEVVNLYGITETTVASTTHALSAHEIENSGASPIGTALPGLEITIRDAGGNEVGPEVSGEIVIGGWGVTSGYIGNAEAKSDRFVLEENSGGEEPSVVYYTGDLGQIRRDGVILYEGRADRQMKVRGYRIEPAEIERALEAHPGVDSAVVCAEQLGGRTSLVAYFTWAEDEGESDVGLLRSHLRQSLPAHEIPAAVIEISEVPLTINGKIDYRALGGNSRTRGDIGIPYSPPRDSAEGLCVSVLEECLGFAPIGIDDSMDALGLDSLAAIEAAVGCMDAGLAVEWADFKSTATVREVARSGALREAPLSVRASAAAVEGPFAMTPAQRRMLDVGSNALSDRGMTTQLNASMMFTVSPQVSDAVLAAAVRDVVARYDALRLVDDLAAGTFRIREPQDVELEEVSIAGAAELPTTVTSLQESVGAGDQRLFRPILIQVEEDGSRRLLMVGHRIAVDGYSIATIGRGIAQRVSGSQIDEHCAGYAAWASTLPRWRPDFLDASARYWLARDWEAEAGGLTHADGIIHSETQMIELAVPPGIVAGMRERARSVGWRSDEVITWCVASALSRLIGTKAALLAIQRHGRINFDGLDVRRTPGCFTIDCPLLLSLPTAGAGDSLPAGVLQQMREAASHAFTYWWLRYYGPDESLRALLAGIPTASLMVNYRGRMLTHTSSAGEPVLHGLPETGVAEKGPGTAEIFRLKLHINDDRLGFVLGLKFSKQHIAASFANALLQDTADGLERISRG